MEPATPNGEETENKDGGGDFATGARLDDSSFAGVHIVKKRSKVYAILNKLWIGGKTGENTSRECGNVNIGTSGNVNEQEILRKDDLKYCGSSGAAGTQELQIIKFRNDKRPVSYSEVTAESELSESVHKCRHREEDHDFNCSVIKEQANHGMSGSVNNERKTIEDFVENVSIASVMNADASERHTPAVTEAKTTVTFSVSDERAAIMTKYDGHCESVRYSRTSTVTHYIKGVSQTSSTSECSSPDDCGDRQQIQEKLQSLKFGSRLSTTDKGDSGGSIATATRTHAASRSQSEGSFPLMRLREYATGYHELPRLTEPPPGASSSPTYSYKPTSRKSLHAAFLSPPLLSMQSLSDNAIDRRMPHRRRQALRSPTGRPWPFSRRRKGSVIYLRRVGAVVEVRQSHAPIEYEVPDGGYGWVCVAAVFIMYTMVVGIYRASGIILVEVKNEFQHASTSLVSLMPSVSVALTVAFAMLAGGLCRKYSSRRVAMISGTLMSLSIMCIYFTTNIGFLFVCYALAGIFGAGASMPGILIIALYFRRHRALATGLALTGTAVGGIFHPPIIQRLSELYSFRGAMVIVGAITLHTLPCAMLLRNPWDPVILAYNKKRKHEEYYEEGDELPYVIPVHHSYPSDTSDEDDELSVVTMRSIPGSNSASDIPYIRSSLLVRKRRTSLGHHLYDNVLHYLTFRRPSKVHYTWAPQVRVYRPHKRHKLEARYSLFEPNRGRFVEWLYNAIYIDLAFLANPVFLVVFLASVFTTGSYPHVVLFLPDHGIRAGGYDAKASALLVTICACGDVLGRIFFGWVFDKQYLSLQYGLFIFTLLISFSLCILVLSTNYVYMSVCVFVYGLAGGPTVLLIPILLSDHHGAASLGSSYGIVRFGQAVICVITPPLAGFLKDETKNYKYSFLLFALSAFIGALMMIFMSWAKKRYRKTAEVKLAARSRQQAKARSQDAKAISLKTLRTGSLLTTRSASTSPRRHPRSSTALDSRSDIALQLDT